MINLVLMIGLALGSRLDGRRVELPPDVTVRRCDLSSQALTWDRPNRAWVTVLAPVGVYVVGMDEHQRPWLLWSVALGARQGHEKLNELRAAGVCPRVRNLW